MKMEAPVIGIDLGTTYSCVGVMKNDKPHIIEIKDGLKTMASIVSYTKNGRIVGDAAKENFRLDPTTTVYAVKRYIGRRFNEIDLHKLKDTYPIEIIDHNNNPRFKIEYKGEVQYFTPEEISATILEKLKEAAEKYLEQEISQAVITVPAHFNDSQRQATIDAGRIAGLEVLRIINEPTAAALAYGIQEKYQENNEACNVLIYDFGGGTFDVSIITIDNSIFEVRATNGDTQLGGDDFDQLLLDHFIAEFQNKYDKILKQDRRAVRRLRLQCEKIKKTLSNSPVATLELESLHEGLDFHSLLTQTQFETLCCPLIERTLHLVGGALKDAQLNKSDIDEVVLVGGSTRIPKVREMVQQYFDGKELNMSHNPDETVAMGAAIQAAILDKNFDSEVLGTLLLMDVNSLSLGLKVIGGVMSVIIPRNTQIPAEKRRQYETVIDYQPGVNISIYEGEREMVKENTLLGAFVMEGLTELPRGQVKFEITFNINTDGILNVTATELNTNKSSSLAVTMDKNRLDDDEIRELIVKANEYQKSDAKWKENMDAKVELQFYCQDLKHNVNEELSRRMKSDEVQIVNLKCNDTLTWLMEHDDQDKLVYNEKRKEVYNVCNPILKLYV